MNRPVGAWVLLLAGLCTSGSAETLGLPVSADLGICAHHKEKTLNTGGNRVIRLKGNQHYYLFTFETEKIRNWQIESAWLRIRVLRGSPLNLAVCTVDRPWVEGKGVNEPTKGASCFSHRVYPDKPWTPGGNTFLEATFNNPRMLWKPAKAKPLANGWIRVPLEPHMVRAVAAGFSHGLAIGEENGQLFENHDVYTRESPYRPEVIIVGSEAPSQPDAPGPEPTARLRPAENFADFRTGALWIEPWGNEGDIARRVTLVGADGLDRSIVTYHFKNPILADRLPTGRRNLQMKVESLEAGRIRTSRRKLPPLAALTAPNEPELPAGPARADIREKGALRAAWLGHGRYPSPTDSNLQAAKMEIPLTPRNAWVALVLAVAFPPDRSFDLGVEITPPRHGEDATEVLHHTRLDRLWALRHKGRWVPDVCVPIQQGQGVDLPWKKNAVPGQSSQMFLIDVWVPASARPGRYRGQVRLADRSGQGVTIPIQLDVASQVLSDSFDVVGSCNTYSSPAGAMGKRPRDGLAFLETERKYHRLAQSCRMAVTPVPYNHAGEVGPLMAPTLEADGGKVRVADWEAFDRRFGPLLSGEAFLGESGYVGPGAGRPIDHMYLPLHENWPLPLARHFKPWPPPKDYRQFLEWTTKLGPIEGSFDEAYRAGWTALLREFYLHLSRRGWTRTRYQVYLNNKHYYRRDGGRGITLWLLDEPMHATDFRALAYFGRMLRRESSTWPKGQARIDFRVDISRPHHQRDWLDGAVDLNVCANRLRSQARQIALRKALHGESYWNYAAPASFERGRDWTLWPLRSLCWGATGTIYWQTIGSDGDLVQADPTALILPGRKFGLDRPLASIRLKCWRDGLQLAQLLLQWQQESGANEMTLRGFVGQACQLGGWQDGIHAPLDSGIVTFDGVDDAGLSRLRQALLEQMRP
jgi:hypothetical protein